MTAPSIANTSATDETLYCYRHPDRETWVRCGRCDRPICTRCAMQGPVGLRCKQCGKPAFDPLTSFKPQQLILGTLTAVVAGLVTGYVAARIGFFSVVLAYFAGGFIAEIITRVTGYKRGPVMFGIVFGGIVLGIVAGSVGAFWMDYGLYSAGASNDPSSPDYFPVQQMLIDAATWSLLSAGAAAFGAWQRLRW